MGQGTFTSGGLVQFYSLAEKNFIKNEPNQDSSVYYIRNINFKNLKMKNKARKIGVVFTLMLGASLLSFTNLSDEIKGWFLAGSNPEWYEIGVENNTERDGKVGFLKSTQSKIKEKGFGTIMQQFTPQDYLGKKVKLSGYIKASNIDNWAGMWMRVDGANNKPLSMDNMQDRPIKGTVGWKKYEIILDIPQESTLIAYGVLLSGTGSVWLDNFEFEIIEESTNTTGSGRAYQLESPTNTDFEESK